MAVSDDIRKEKEKAKDMSFKGKLSYFWYYYKVHTIVAIVIIVFLCALIKDISSSKDYAFYATYFNAEQTFSAETALADGKYLDRVSGNAYEVKDGVITGKIAQQKDFETEI